MKKEEKKHFKHEGHKIITRRDLLAQGFYSLSAMALAPNVLSVLSNTAYAQDCPTTSTSSLFTPVIIIDLAGGGNIAGSNVMVGRAQGQLDFISDYRSLGLPPDFSPNRAGMIDQELGLAFHRDSKILAGIKLRTSAQTRANVDGAIFCVTSDDDTQNNQINPAYWLVKAGAQGSLAQIIGSESSLSGGRSKAPQSSIMGKYYPIQINGRDAGKSLVNIGRLGQNLGSAKAQKVLEKINKFSENKILSFSRLSITDQLRNLLRCGFIGTKDLVSGRFSEAALDPVNDTVISTVFNLNNEGSQAAITKLILDGHAAVGTITLGGFDYHDGTRATGNIADQRCGELIGKILEAAARKNKDVIVYVLTDGGVGTNMQIDNSVGGEGKYLWSGDSGVRSSSFMLTYNRNGRISLRSNGRQIGAYKDNGANDSSASLISNSVVNGAKAMVANYLAIHGREGDLAGVVGDNPFSSQYDKYLIFNRKT